MSDLVASWDIALSDGVHKVEFEHGTTTGKRVITVDGKVIKIHKSLHIHSNSFEVYCCCRILPTYLDFHEL